MKSLSVLLMLSIFSLSVFAQKKYVDPNERQKRGLQEEGEVSATMSNETLKTEVSSLTPQAQLCECVKLKNMNDKLEDVWYGSSKVDRAVTSKEEIDSREDNVEATLVYIITQNKNDKKLPISQQKCAGTEVGERNLNKLISLIEKQESKCDVYKLRGIDND